jgi:pentatricopeptide repeat protein
MVIKGNVESVMSYWTEMKDSGISANTMHYNAVILAYSKIDDFDTMVQYYDEMKEVNQRPILDTFSPIIGIILRVFLF